MSDKEYELEVARQANFLKELKTNAAFNETVWRWVAEEGKAADALILAAFTENNPLKAAVYQGYKMAFQFLVDKADGILAKAEEFKLKALKRNEREQTIRERGYL